MVTLGAIMDLGLLPEFQSIKRAGIKPASYVPKNSVMLAERAAKAEAREKRVAAKIAEKAAARASAKAEKAAVREVAKEASKSFASYPSRAIVI